MSAFDAFRAVVFIALWAGWSYVLTSEDRGPVLAAIIAIGPVIAVDRFIERQRDWRDPAFAPEPSSLRFVFGFPVVFTAVFVGIALVFNGPDDALSAFGIFGGVAALFAVGALLARQRAIRRRRALGRPESGPVDPQSGPEQAKHDPAG